MKFFKKHSKSFTIIELIIAVAIIIILSVIIIANYEWGGYQIELQEATQKVVQDMSKIRNETLSSPITSSPPGIYIKVSSSKYVLFRDLDSDGEYDEGEAQQIVDLGKDIYFQTFEWDLEYGEKRGTPGSLTLFFIPPEPTVRIIVGGEQKNAAVIILWSKKAEATSSILITETGLIEVR